MAGAKVEVFAGALCRHPGCGRLGNTAYGGLCLRHWEEASHERFWEAAVHPDQNRAAEELPGTIQRMGEEKGNVDPQEWRRRSDAAMRLEEVSSVRTPERTPAQSALLSQLTWTCQSCTLANPLSALRCNACNVPRHWVCTDCGTSNRGLDNSCFKCRRPREWVCPTCTFHNRLPATVCGMCQWSVPPTEQPPPPPPPPALPGEGQLEGSFANRLTASERRVLVEQSEQEGARNEDIEKGKPRLQERVRELGCVEQEMPDDGNCLFRAISFQLWRTQRWHVALRRKVVAWLDETRSEFVDFFDGGDAEIGSYLERMSRTGTWGDEHCLRAAADCLGATLHVVQSTEGLSTLLYSPKQQTPGRHIFLSYLAPVHYNGLGLKDASEKFAKEDKADSILAESKLVYDEMRESGCFASRVQQVTDALSTIVSEREEMKKEVEHLRQLCLSLASQERRASQESPSQEPLSGAFPPAPAPGISPADAPLEPAPPAAKPAEAETQVHSTSTGEEAAAEKAATAPAVLPQWKTAPPSAPAGAPPPIPPPKLDKSPSPPQVPLLGQPKVPTGAPPLVKQPAPPPPRPEPSTPAPQPAGDLPPMSPVSPVKGEEGFERLRLVIEAVKSGAPPVELGGLEVLGTADTVLKIKTSCGPGAKFGKGEGPEVLVQKDKVKFTESEMKPIQIDLSELSHVCAYRLRYADQNRRYPVKWRMEGWRGGAWITLHRHNPTTAGSSPPPWSWTPSFPLTANPRSRSDSSLRRAPSRKDAIERLASGRPASTLARSSSRGYTSAKGSSSGLSNSAGQANVGRRPQSGLVAPAACIKVRDGKLAPKAQVRSTVPAAATGRLRSSTPAAGRSSTPAAGGSRQRTPAAGFGGPNRKPQNRPPARGAVERSRTVQPVATERSRTAQQASMRGVRLESPVKLPDSAVQLAKFFGGSVDQHNRLPVVVLVCGNRFLRAEKKEKSICWVKELARATEFHLWLPPADTYSIGLSLRIPDASPDEPSFFLRAIAKVGLCLMPSAPSGDMLQREKLRYEKGTLCFNPPRSAGAQTEMCFLGRPDDMSTKVCPKREEAAEVAFCLIRGAEVAVRTKR